MSNPQASSSGEGRSFPAPNVGSRANAPAKPTKSSPSPEGSISGSSDSESMDEIRRRVFGSPLVAIRPVDGPRRSLLGQDVFDHGRERSELLTRSGNVATGDRYNGLNIHAEDDDVSISSHDSDLIEIAPENSMRSRFNTHENQIDDEVEAPDSTADERVSIASASNEDQSDDQVEAADAPDGDAISVTNSDGYTPGTEAQIDEQHDVDTQSDEALPDLFIRLPELKLEVERSVQELTRSLRAATLRFSGQLRERVEELERYAINYPVEAIRPYIPLITRTAQDIANETMHQRIYFTSMITLYHMRAQQGVPNDSRPSSPSSLSRDVQDDEDPGRRDAQAPRPAQKRRQGSQSDNVDCKRRRGA